MWQIIAPFSLVVTEVGPAQLSLFMFKGVLLINIKKEHLKVFLVSSEVGQGCLSVCFLYFFLKFLLMDALESKNILRTQNFHCPFVQYAYGQNRLKCAKEAVISLKL